MLLLLFAFSALLIYIYLKRHYDYWKRGGIPGPTPQFLFGNTKPCFFYQKSFGEVFAEIYNKYRALPLVGIFIGTDPAVITIDPELIRDVLIKDFSNFHDNDFYIYVDEKTDPFPGKNLFFLTGKKWKIVRTQLTPGFTNLKVKTLYPLIQDTSQKLVQFIDEGSFDAKDLCTKFTVNNVASCAFGVDGRCFEDPNSDFNQIPKDFFQPDSFSSYLTTMFPVTKKFFSLRLMSKKIESKVREIVTASVKYRRENGIVRNDYLDMLIQLKETSKEYQFTDEDIASHCTGFYLDGTETSSLAMAYFLYELGKNDEVQKKLREEVNDRFEENGNISFEDLQNMPYLDAVFNETLRLHPPLQVLGKVCTKTFTYNAKINNVEKRVTIEEGTSVFIPVYALHHDSQYFQDPQSFNPERFLGENKEKIPKYAYLPFGDGPRICIGRRFGELQVKAGIAYIVKNFKIAPSEKTKLPFRFTPMSILALPLDGLFVDFQRI